MEKTPNQSKSTDEPMRPSAVVGELLRLKDELDLARAELKELRVELEKVQVLSETLQMAVYGAGVQLEERNFDMISETLMSVGELWFVDEVADY